MAELDNPLFPCSHLKYIILNKQQILSIVCFWSVYYCYVANKCFYLGGYKSLKSQIKKFRIRDVLFYSNSFKFLKKYLCL